MKNWKLTTVLGGLLLPLALLLYTAPALAEGQCIPISYTSNASPQAATALSHDGSMLLMTSSSYVVLYHIESGEQIQTYSNPYLPAHIQGVLWDEEKNHVLASHIDGTISAWDATSGELLSSNASNIQNADDIGAMNYGYTHNRWEIAGEDTLLKSYNLYTMQAIDASQSVSGWSEIRTYDRNAPNLYQSSLVPTSDATFPLDASGRDEKVVAAHAGRLKVVQWPDTELANLGTESDTADGVPAWSPDGNTIISIGASDLYLLDAESGAILQKIPHEQGRPDIVDWTQGVLFAAYADGRINIYDEENLTVASSINVAEGTLLAAHASPTGRRISFTTRNSDPEIVPLRFNQYVYDLNSGETFTLFESDSESIDAWSRAPGSSHTAFANRGTDDLLGVMNVWRGSRLPRQIFFETANGGSAVTGLALSPDAKEAVVVTYNKKTRYAVDSGLILHQVDEGLMEAGRQFEYSEDGKFILAKKLGVPSYMFDAKTLEYISSITAPLSPIYASVDANDNIQVIDRATQTIIQSIPVELDNIPTYGLEQIAKLKLSDDGTVVAASIHPDTNDPNGTPIGRLRLYDVATGEFIQEYPQPGYDLAFIENDRFLHFRTWGFGFAKLAVRPTPCDGGEGESTLDAADILARFHSMDYDRNGLAGRGPVMVEFGISLDTFAALDTSGDFMLSVKELTAQIEGPLPIHSADADADGAIAIGELLRVIQLYNSGGYTCASDPNDTEDGYQPAAKGALDPTCRPHASDYQDNNGTISLSELLRLIQLYTIGALSPCPEAEDGFCAAA